MKKLIFILVAFLAISTTAQTSPNFKTIKLTAPPAGSSSDDLLSIGTDKFIKKITKTSLLSGTVPSSRKLTINGTELDLSQDRAWTIAGGGGTSTDTLTEKYVPVAGPDNTLVDSAIHAPAGLGRVGINMTSTSASTLALAKNSYTAGSIGGFLNNEEKTQKWGIHHEGETVNFFGGSNKLKLFVPASTSTLVLNSDGIGVGDTNFNPTERFHVEGTVKATSFVKDGGLSTQFLMADGSVSTATGGSAEPLEVNNTNKTVWNSGKYSNTNASYFLNTSFGNGALVDNTQGYGITAIGYAALENNTTGTGNTALGSSASAMNVSGNNIISIGYYSNSGFWVNNPENSIFIGNDTKALNADEVNQIVIGHNATGAGSNTVTLGNTSIVKTVLRGTLNAAGLPTFADNTAATTGGLTAGDMYRTSTGVLMIVF